MPIKKIKKSSVNEENETEKEFDETDTKKESKKSREGISDAIEAIRNKFGEEAIMKLGEKPKVNINAIPTGSIGLDSALGIGGMPRGRIIEIFGPESSGKTTLEIGRASCRERVSSPV